VVIDILIFILGLAVGSFLNVAIQRLPREESIVKPGSRCPKCLHPIAWYDNIPALSFMVLAGRCRYCKERISWRYPLVELASGIFWYAHWRMSPGSALFGVSVIFFSLLLVASVADFETGLIPDEVSLGGLVAGVGLSFFWPTLHGQAGALRALGQSVLGLLVGGGLIYLTGLAGNWIFQRELMSRGLEESMGGGDVKLLAMAGSFLGWEKVLLTFFTAPILGLPFAIYARLRKQEAVIPYGPFLSLACLVQFYFGDFVWRYFLGI